MRNVFADLNFDAALDTALDYATDYFTGGGASILPSSSVADLLYSNIAPRIGDARLGHAIARSRAGTKGRPRHANTPNNIIANNVFQEYRNIYGQTKAHSALLQAMYAVKIENVYKLSGDIPWFKDSSLMYLVTDADVSLGSAESDSYYAGAYQNGLLTQKTDGELELTFIETANGDIAKSFMACHNLAFNADGTVNEPRKYAFKITIGFIKPKSLKEAAFKKTWIVGALTASTQASSTGRSEIVKLTISLQKLRPVNYG